MDRRKVLVIEDEWDIAQLLELHLRDIHCEVVLAADGHQGMRQAFARRWDLVILDIRLPGPDGLSICRALRRDLSYVPILVLTSKSSELDRVLGELDSYDSVSLGFIDPGGTDSAILATRGSYSAISIASMLIPTNDTFFAVNGVDGPRGNKAITLWVPAYDAGTELNDELCANLPGPDCNEDPGPTSNNGEGYVYISGGIRGVGGVDADLRDFNNPVARITIRRLP